MGINELHNAMMMSAAVEGRGYGRTKLMMDEIVRRCREGDRVLCVAAKHRHLAEILDRVKVRLQRDGVSDGDIRHRLRGAVTREAGLALRGTRDVVVFIDHYVVELALYEAKGVFHSLMRENYLLRERLDKLESKEDTP